MAFEVKKINPLDRQPRKAIGVDLPFSGQAVFNSTFQTKDAIKVNLINYLLTNKGERPLNPTFGGGLREYVFANIDREQLKELQSNLAEEINVVFNNIVLTELKVIPATDSNLINVFIKYAIKNQNINDELLITVN